MPNCEAAWAHVSYFVRVYLSQKRTVYCTCILHTNYPSFSYIGTLCSLYDSLLYYYRSIHVFFTFDIIQCTLHFVLLFPHLISHHHHTWKPPKPPKGSPKAFFKRVGPENLPARDPRYPVLSETSYTEFVSSLLTFTTPSVSSLFRATYTSI